MSQIKDIEHVAEFAAVGYYGSKLARGDVNAEASKGRVGGSVNVRSNGEYAAVAGGHMVLGGFGAVIYAHVLLFWIVASGFGINLIISGMGLTPGSGLWCGVMAVIWLVFCIGYLGLYLPLHAIWNHGPSISYADGYRGPTGHGETHYTCPQAKYDVELERQILRVKSESRFPQERTPTSQPIPRQLRQG
jgi:hypothetical protein